MITLNSDKGLVRIECWEDVETRPGFTKDIDPRTIKLKAILGSYAFSDHIPCGLSSCHQPHGHGYLVVTHDGRETNIGKDCGKKYFAVDFVTMQKMFDRELKASLNREYLWSIRNRLPSIRIELDGLKQGPYGASWMHSQIVQLLGQSGSLPRSITNAVKEAIRSNGALKIQRALTKEERKIRDVAADVTGLEHRRTKTEQFTTEKIGQIDGYASLLNENSLRGILVGKLEPFIAALGAADLDSLPRKELNALYRAGSDFDVLLQRLKNAIADGTRLLQKNNIAQLLAFATNNGDRRAVQTFIGGLPATN